jgi:hypothetical protein
MDTYQKAYAEYLRQRVSKGLDLHPDGCIAFVAGYKAAREEILAMFKDNTCNSCEEDLPTHRGCESNVDAIFLIESEIK